MACMLWTIAITAVVTVLCVIVAMNFAVPEKKLERKVQHLYPADDPQFRRDMGNLLPPGGAGLLQLFLERG